MYALAYVYQTFGDRLVYSAGGCGVTHHVVDDGLWLGPVPMPGEWVSREEHEQLIEDCTRSVASNPKGTGWLL
jgi:hypothetical protein